MSEKTTIPKRSTKVIGIGHRGSNFINHMNQSKFDSVELIYIDIDTKELAESQAKVRVQIGNGATSMLDTGADPEVGRFAAEESRDKIRDLLTGAEIVVISAGMGGVTGTGAAPVIASIAKEMGIKVIAVTTTPFDFEGEQRIQNAKDGLEKLQADVDELLITKNQELLALVNDETTIEAVFKISDGNIYKAIQKSIWLVG
jgi:cell division protein FtsZ